MGSVKRMTTLLLAAASALIVVYLVVRIVASLMQGYSWQEMDWGQRGSTSIADFFAASDIGKRQITQDGKPCTEYFSYKDGMPVKVVCSK